MLYKIIGDSCMDLTEELKLDPHFQITAINMMSLLICAVYRLGAY